jgi:hypothetical protein
MKKLITRHESELQASKLVCNEGTDLLSLGLGDGDSCFDSRIDRTGHVQLAVRLLAVEMHTCL